MNKLTRLTDHSTFLLPILSIASPLLFLFFSFLSSFIYVFLFSFKELINCITPVSIQVKTMARRSARFKAVDGDGDENMEVEGMLVA